VKLALVLLLAALAALAVAWFTSLLPIP